MTEAQVEKFLREHLSAKGWRIRGDAQARGAHGVDIYAQHPRWRKLLFVEVKGGSGKHKHQECHNAFYNVLGQCLARMDKEGNSPNRARIYAIGIPSSWEKTFKSKIKKMKYGWELLKLKVFLVKETGKVEEKPYRYFLQ
jgi:hypothetical protein